MTVCLPRVLKGGIDQCYASWCRDPQWWLLGLGALLRVKHYAESCPFWLDEAWVAVSITSRSYSEILNNFQVFPGFAHPPVLFVVLEKFFANSFGNHELVLRAVPVLAGVGALYLFWLLSKTILSPRMALWSLGLLVILEPAVYYAVQLKQYSVDMLLCLAFLWAALSFVKGGAGWIKVFFLAVFGACALWLSSALVFVLAAIVCVWAIDLLIRRDGGGVLKLGVVGSAWALSFIVNYKFFLSEAVGNQAIMGMWQGAFYTGSFLSWQMPLWMMKVFVESFRDLLGSPLGLLAVAVFVVGVVSLWRRDVRIALLLMLPIVLTLLAALIGKYPFRGRVILFLAPLLILGTFEGVEYLLKKAGRWMVPAALVLFLAIFAAPLVQAGNALIQGRMRVDNRKAVEFFAKHYQPGDFIFMNTSGQPPFWYYANTIGVSARFPRFTDPAQPAKLVPVMKVGKFACHLIRGPQGNRAVVYRYEYNIYDEKGFFRADIIPRSAQEDAHIVVAGLMHPYPPSGRTWVFLSGDEPDDIIMNDVIRGSFDMAGPRLLGYEGKNAGAYLYHLGQ